MGGQCYIVCPSIEQSEESGFIVDRETGEVISEGSLHLKSAVDFEIQLKPHPA